MTQYLEETRLLNFSHPDIRALIAAREFERHGQKLGPVKGWLFRNYGRHRMNRTVAGIRRGG